MLKFLNNSSDFETLDNEADKKPYLDSKGVPTVGVGSALLVEKNGTWGLKDPFPSGVEPADKKVIEDVMDDLNAGKSASEIESSYGTTFKNMTTSLGDDEIKDLLQEDVEENTKTALTRIKNRINENLEEGESKWNLLDETDPEAKSVEDTFNSLPEGAKTAIISVAFNQPSALDKGLSLAVKEKNLSKLLYEVGFNSDDTTEVKGIRNRRFLFKQIF